MTIGDGANKLYRDSGIGLAVNAAVTAGAAIVLEWLATLPALTTALVAGGVGIVVNAITAWKSKRTTATGTTTLDR